VYGAVLYSRTRRFPALSHPVAHSAEPNLGAIEFRHGDVVDGDAGRPTCKLGELRGQIRIAHHVQSKPDPECVPVHYRGVWEFLAIIAAINVPRPGSGGQSRARHRRSCTWVQALGLERGRRGAAERR